MHTYPEEGLLCPTCTVVHTFTGKEPHFASSASKQIKRDSSNRHSGPNEYRMDRDIRTNTKTGVVTRQVLGKHPSTAHNHQADQVPKVLHHMITETHNKSQYGH